MTFVIRHTGGVVCLALSDTIANQLDLPPMVEPNTARLQTAFTVSIDAAEGIATGISARDRAQTVRAAINPAAQAGDLVRPGHIFPLRAQQGGTLRRTGHTEAAVDLCRLAGLREGAIISELMHDDGTMMRLPDLQAFAQQHDLPIIAIADIIAYRRRSETYVRREAEADVETDTGMWHMVVYRDTIDQSEHVALTMGKIDAMTPVLVRMHSECLTGDVFGSLQCDCGVQLKSAMACIAAEGTGALVYMRQEGRGIGLSNKIRAYELQRARGLDTVEANEELGFPADLRDYGAGAQILKDLGVGKLRLLTNNPQKIIGLQGYGLHVVDRVPLQCAPASKHQQQYLRTKRVKMGHLILGI